MGTESSLCGGWMGVGGQGELLWLQDGGKPECAVMVTVVVLPEAPDIPIQICSCYSWFSARRLHA